MPIALIVGLGNPGTSYQVTRHNAGFWFIDRVAAQVNGQFRLEPKFKGEICRSGSLWLLKPMTFMNRSGESVAAVAHFYKIPAPQILVAHDELDFPPGVARLKQGGGDGKHNGLKDLITQLHDNQFLRLRIGIGHPGKGADVSKYVLNAPLKEERLAIETVIETALSITPLIVNGELDRAMRELHVVKP